MDNLSEKGQLIDSHPIRACCFSPDGEYIGIGTNSKCLKICSLKEIINNMDKSGHCNIKNHRIRTVFNQNNHHAGSIYCIDWYIYIYIYIYIGQTQED